MTIHFTIPGSPATKKTSDVLNLRGSRPRKLPSDSYRRWHKMARTYVPNIRAHARCEFPISSPCSVRALFYRAWNTTGDLLGYEQALADFLQANDVRILENDRLIESWDGSRRLIDAAWPRIEVTITLERDKVDIRAQYMALARQKMGSGS